MTDNKILQSETVVLNHIPVNIDINSITERVTIPTQSKRITQLIRELIEINAKIAVPKAVYRVSAARNAGRNIIVDGVELTCYVPTLEFKPQEVVFPYIVTCGVEIDRVEVSKSDFMKHYLMNMIKETLLYSAAGFLEKHLIEKYKLKQLTHIGPGEALGPLDQQRELFSIIGDVENKIGVTLTEHNLMIPEKSTSGIFFETVIRLERCTLCPDLKCESRRASYEPKILLQYHS